MTEYDAFKLRFGRRPRLGDVAVFYCKLKYGHDYKYRYSVYSFNSKSYLTPSSKATGLHHLAMIAERYGGVRVNCVSLPSSE